MTNLVEDELLRDDPLNPEYRSGMPHDARNRRVFTRDRPETQEFIRQMRDVLDEFPDRVLIGEVHLPLARAMTCYGAQRPFFHLPFKFQLVVISNFRDRAGESLSTGVALRPHEGLIAEYISELR